MMSYRSAGTKSEITVAEGLRASHTAALATKDADTAHSTEACHSTYRERIVRMITT